MILFDVLQFKINNPFPHITHQSELMNREKGSWIKRGHVYYESQIIFILNLSSFSVILSSSSCHFFVFSL